MAEALQSTGVILPEDWRPDDTKLVFNKDGIPFTESENNHKAFREEFPGDCQSDEDIELALAYYNAQHNTDYEPIGGCKLCLYRKNPNLKGEEKEKEMKRRASHWWETHYGFFAAPMGSQTAVKFFSCDVSRPEFGCEPVVTCSMVDGTTPTDCSECNDLAVLDHTARRLPPQPEDDPVLTWELVTPPPSEYIGALADGVELSDKAKFRLRFTLHALAHYNEKHPADADYKLVDVLPYAMTFGGGPFVAHCNFIAKRNAPGASNELFFAELDRTRDDWVVTACCIVRGKAKAGCHQCRPVSGKRVIHPTRGYRYGLRPDTRYLRPKLRSQTRSCMLYKPS